MTLHPVLRAALLPVAGTLALLAVRPGVVVNGLRSPLAWVAVAGTVLLSLGARALARRAGAPVRLASGLGTLVVLGCLALLLAPSFRQTTLVEQVPVAVAAPAADAELVVAPPSPSSSVVKAAPRVAAPPAPAAADRAAELEGIGHSARGTVLLREAADGTYLVFQDVDVEGTVDPSVHLVAPGQRTPGGGVRLGALKAERGTFSYRLPDGVDGSRGWSVLVWCDPYDTPIAAADLPT